MSATSTSVQMAIMYLAMQGTIFDLQSGKPWAWGRYPEREAKHRRPKLILPGTFVPFFELPFLDRTEDEIRRVAALIKVAQTVFTIWLGAVGPRSKPLVKRFIPWDSQHIHYKGFFSNRMLMWETSAMRQPYTRTGALDTPEDEVP